MRKTSASSRHTIALAIAAAIAFGVFTATAQTTERIVSDPRSGTAIYGFDPVAYFIDGAAHAGEGSFEMRFGGLVWRFRSEANRAAFAQSPERFVPEFGGYDPVSAGDGVPVAGHPRLFAILNGKLFLFSSEAHRARFKTDAKLVLELAHDAWPEISRTLVP